MSFEQYFFNRLVNRALSVSENPATVLNDLDAQYDADKIRLLEGLIRMRLEQRASATVYELLKRFGADEHEIEQVNCHEYTAFTVDDVMRDLDYNAIYAQTLAIYRNINDYKP